MSPPKRKDLKAGGRGYGYEPSDADFLKNDRNPWKATASGHGYNSKFSDDDGYVRGEHGFQGSDNESYLRPSFQGEDTVTRTVDEPIDTSISWVEGEGRGEDFRESFGGSSPVTGGGNGPPRYSPKTGPRYNAPGGTDKRGRR